MKTYENDLITVKKIINHSEDVMFRELIDKLLGYFGYYRYDECDGVPKVNKVATIIRIPEEVPNECIHELTHVHLLRYIEENIKPYMTVTESNEHNDKIYRYELKVLSEE